MGNVRKRCHSIVSRPDLFSAEEVGLLTRPPQNKYIFVNGGRWIPIRWFQYLALNANGPFKGYCAFALPATLRVSECIAVSLFSSFYIVIRNPSLWSRLPGSGRAVSAAALNRCSQKAVKIAFLSRCPPSQSCIPHPRPKMQIWCEYCSEKRISET